MSSEQYDVIVCGAGSAGQAAAIFAARKGAKVLAIEHGDEIGGNTARSTGQMSAAGTRLQKARGIHDTPDLHFDDIMRISHGTADPVIVRLAVDNAADTLHWLLDHGLELLPGMPVVFKGHEPYRVARTYWGPDRGGPPVQKVLGPQFQSEVVAARIALRLETEVTDLIQDGAAVVGVVARSKDGTVTSYRGKNVILTMGGYAANEKVLPKYTGGYPLWKGGPAFGSHPRANGTSHQLGEKVGGYVRFKEFFLPTVGFVKDPDNPGGTAIITKMLGSAMGPRVMWEIWVNAKGERWVNEATESPDEKENAILGIPDLTFWCIYDQAAREKSDCLFMGRTHEQVDPWFNTHDSFRRADTLDGLAKAMGVEAAGFKRTIERYNAFVGRGKDDDFGREMLPAPIAVPPFYGIAHHGLSITGFAGLAVNGELQVVKPDGSAIPGLYAAGESLGLGATSGRSFCGGMALMPAMTFGRLLGDRILKW